MLQTRNLVPDIYYNYSRDFQFLGRTFEVIFNYLKMNIDLMPASSICDKPNDKIVDLLAKTLGFNAKHDYDMQDLKSICNVFVELVRNKGSKDAIEKACLTLMNSQNISGYLKVDVDITDYVVNIYLPQDVSDIVLLEDLFDYILPAGFEYRFIKSTMFEGSLNNEYTTQSKLKLFRLNNTNIGKIAQANNTANTKKPDMIDVTEGSVDSNSEIATTFTGKIIK